MTPEVYHDWVIEVHDKEYTEELFNSDLKEYDGTGDVFNRDIHITECIDEEFKNIKSPSIFRHCRIDFEINLKACGKNQTTGFLIIKYLH